jgi:hypothetical protein
MHDNLQMNLQMNLTKQESILLDSLGKSECQAVPAATCL